MKKFLLFFVLFLPVLLTAQLPDVPAVIEKFQDRLPSRYRCGLLHSGGHPQKCHLVACLVEHQNFSGDHRLHRRDSGSFYGRVTGIECLRNNRSCRHII
jgi:hypothetical protein